MAANGGAGVHARRSSFEDGVPASVATVRDAFACAQYTYEAYAARGAPFTYIAMAPSIAFCATAFSEPSLVESGRGGTHFVGFFEDAPRKHLFVCFMGSVTGADWRTNFAAFSNAALSGDAGGFGVSHAGFSARAAGAPIDTIIARLRAGWRVVLTGHSLGGAVASLVTHRILFHPSSDPHEWISGRRLTCITFGAPLIANAAFHRSAVDLQYSNAFLHIVHPDDIVMRAPRLGKAAFDKLVDILAIVAAECLTAFAPPPVAALGKAVIKVLPALAKDVVPLAPDFAPYGWYMFLSSAGHMQPAFHVTKTELSGDQACMFAMNVRQTNYEAVQAHLMGAYHTAILSLGALPVSPNPHPGGAVALRQASFTPTIDAASSYITLDAVESHPSCVVLSGSNLDFVDRVEVAGFTVAVERRSSNAIFATVICTGGATVSVDTQRLRCKILHSLSHDAVATEVRLQRPPPMHSASERIKACSPDVLIGAAVCLRGFGMGEFLPADNPDVLASRREAQAEVDAAVVELVAPFAHFVRVAVRPFTASGRAAAESASLVSVKLVDYIPEFTKALRIEAQQAAEERVLARYVAWRRLLGRPLSDALLASWLCTAPGQLMQELRDEATALLSDSYPLPPELRLAAAAKLIAAMDAAEASPLSPAGSIASSIPAGVAPQTAAAGVGTTVSPDSAGADSEPLLDIVDDWHGAVARVRSSNEQRPEERTALLVEMYATVIAAFIRCVRGPAQLKTLDATRDSVYLRRFRNKFCRPEDDDTTGGDDGFFAKLGRTASNVLSTTAKAMDGAVKGVGEWADGTPPLIVGAGYEARVRDLYRGVSTVPGLRPESVRPDTAPLADIELELVRIFMEGEGGLRRKLQTSPDVLGSVCALEVFETLLLPKLDRGADTHAATQLLTLRLLALVDAVAAMRMRWEDVPFIPVQGMQDSGKSTLLVSGVQASIQPGLGANTRFPTVLAHTVLEDDGVARRIALIDFPAATDTQGVYGGLGVELLRVATASVVVMRVGEANNSVAQDLLKRLCAASAAPVLVCINAVDKLFNDCVDDAIKENPDIMVLDAESVYGEAAHLTVRKIALAYSVLRAGVVAPDRVTAVPTILLPAAIAARLPTVAAHKSAYGVADCLDAWVASQRAALLVHAGDALGDPLPPRLVPVPAAAPRDRDETANSCLRRWLSCAEVEHTIVWTIAQVLYCIDGWR